MLIMEMIVSPVFFSIRIPETYQVADTLLLPPPSTIGGALAYSYAVWKSCKFTEALQIFAKSWFFAIPLREIVLSSIVLRRCRLLQKREPLRDGDKKWIASKYDSLMKMKGLRIVKVKKKKKEALEIYLGDQKVSYRDKMLETFRKISHPCYWEYYSKQFFDAMIRRYAFTERMYIGAVIPTSEKFIPSFTRLGDTESFVSITAINFIKDFTIDEISSGKIESDSYVFLVYNNAEIARPYKPLPIQMMSSPLYLIERNTGNAKKYICPAVLPLHMSIRQISSREIEVYLPTKVEVEIKRSIDVISYKSKLLNQNLTILIPKEVISK